MPRLRDVALGQGIDMLLELVATTDAKGDEASVWRASALTTNVHRVRRL